MCKIIKSKKELSGKQNIERAVQYRNDILQKTADKNRKTSRKNNRRCRIHQKSRTIYHQQTRRFDENQPNFRRYFQKIINNGSFSKHRKP